MEETNEELTNQQPKKKSSLSLNVIFNLIYQILSMLAPLITTPYISRVLSSEGVGIFSYSTSLVTYFTLFSGLGTAIYGTREIARLRDNKRNYSKSFWEIELITIFTSLISLSIWIIIALVYVRYQIYLLILCFSIVAIIFDISWLYAGIEKFKYSIIINAIFKILSVAMIFLFVKSEDDIWKYVLIFSGSIFLGNLSMWMFLPKVIKLVKPELACIKKHLKETLVYFIPTIASSIYTVLDKSLIGIFTQNDSENGYYEQATKIINVMKTISFTALNGVMTSRMSYLYFIEDEEQIKKYSQASINISLFFTIACIFGIAGVARNFVPLFLGEGYDPTILLIYIFCPLILFICISDCLGSMYYTPSGRRKLSTRYLIIGAISNLILNCILIPIYGAKGAAIASVVAELIIAILYFCNCNSFITVKNLFKFLWKKIIAGAIMFVAIYFSYYINVNVMLLLGIQVIGGMIIYSAILLILQDKFFIDFIKGAIKKLKEVK